MCPKRGKNQEKLGKKSKKQNLGKSSKNQFLKEKKSLESRLLKEKRNLGLKEKPKKLNNPWIDLKQ